MSVRAALLLLVGGLAACAPERASSPAPLDVPLPARLSELRVLEGVADLAPVGGVAYALGHPLFSDYARKYRTVHLPAGARAVASGDAATLDFPVGTHLTKTFYYPERDGAVVLGEPAAFRGPDVGLDTTGLRLLETRVLRRTEAGWEAVSYVWDADGRDASKARTGALIPLATADGQTFDYLVPDANQCAGCHATDHGSGALAPIGPKPGNLAAVTLAGGGDQYAYWRAQGLVTGAAAAAWPREGEGAARAYLDANCAHCHSTVGAADTAGLDLSYAAERDALGVCKSPVAAGRGSGGRAYDVWPGRADASILLYRMDHTDPGVMMPELGRSLVHAEGVERIRAWIDHMEGDCDAGQLL